MLSQQPAPTRLGRSKLKTLNIRADQFLAAAVDQFQPAGISADQRLPLQLVDSGLIKWESLTDGPLEFRATRVALLLPGSPAPFVQLTTYIVRSLLRLSL